MGFCDANADGIDDCADWANSTMNHIDCATGWSDDADYGQLDAGGCDVGCAPCLDYPAEMMWHADWRDGVRWLRPMADNFDAMGRRHDLRTGEAWPIPHGASYGYGSCYHNGTGEECFNRSVCRQMCWPGGFEFMWTEHDVCPNGAVLGEPIETWFPDVYYFNGSTWEPYLYCRRFPFPNGQIAPIMSDRLYGGRLRGPAFPRFGQIPFAMDVAHTPCAPNALIPCVDKFGGSQCPSGYANDPNLPPGLEHWNAAVDSRNRFAYVHIDGAGIDVVDGPSRPAQAIAALRGVVLRKAFRDPLPSIMFDRLDHQIGVPNGDVRLWTRSFNLEQDTAYLADPRTLVAFLSRCRTANGELITILVQLLSFEVALMLEFHRIARWTGPRTPAEYEFDLHARVWAKAVIAYRTIAPGGPEPPPGVRFIDNQGRHFLPPQSAEWFGYVGHLGINGPQIFPLDISGTLEHMCGMPYSAHGIIDQMSSSNPLLIYGWPNRSEPQTPAVAWPYTGRMLIWFA